MAQFLRSGGSMKRRERTSDIATLQAVEKRKWKVAQTTLEALDQFDEGLLAQQEAAARVMDDLHAEADAASNEASSRRDEPSSLSHSRRSISSRKSMRRSVSMPKALQGLMEDPAHRRRPPSPLVFYDYGAVSVKPRSMFGQHLAKEAASAGASHSKSTGNLRSSPILGKNKAVYFPGPHFKGGPYGFSIAEPMLLSPKCWEKTSQPAMYALSDAQDMRPLASEEHGHRHALSGSPVSPSTVKATSAHARRAERSFRCLDRRREESLLEQTCFEQGVSKGRWRDPLLDNPSLEEPPAENYDWLAQSASDMSPNQRIAARILFRLEHVARRSRGNLAQLFVGQQSGHPGILEPEEFLRGLFKNLIVDVDEFTPQLLIAVLSSMDPAFDGRVHLPRLARAVNAARGVRVAKEKAADDVQQQRQVKLSTSYSESIPVDVIKVDRNESSLLNFNRSFQKFMSQQKGLLDHHNAAMAGNDQFL